MNMGGVPLPFSTSHIFSGPLTNPSYKDTNMFEPQTWKGIFKIPGEIAISEISGTLKIVATIQDMGTSTIKKKITIKTKRKLPKPTLSYPADGATLSTYCYGCDNDLYTTYLSFSWDDVAWATKYEISFHDKYDNYTVTQETERSNYYGYSPCLNSNHQYWTWKVRAGNEYCWSDWSEERNFTIKFPLPPDLITPAEWAILDNGCSSTQNQMVWNFDWTDVSRSYQYNLVVYKAGSQNQYINTIVYGSQYTYISTTYISESDRHNWKWKVRAYVGNCWSDWSEERNFTVEPVNTDCP
jgi:hypothetical protein